VIEQALETAAMMLATDKSRGYCLEICADFLAGANLQNGDAKMLLLALDRLYSLLPHPQKHQFLESLKRVSWPCYDLNVREFDAIRSRITDYVNRFWNATSGVASTVARPLDWTFTTLGRGGA
jgi:hypothetical protein